MSIIRTIAFSAAAAGMLPSLGGHLLYGAILGVSYQWLQQRSPRFATAIAA